MRFYFFYIGHFILIFPKKLNISHHYNLKNIVAYSGFEHIVLDDPRTDVEHLTDCASMDHIILEF